TENGHSGCSTILESSLPADKALELYDQRLQAAGWKPPDLKGMGYDRGGFAIESPDVESRAYCKGEDGPSLYVTVGELPGGSVEIRVGLSTDPERSPCRPIPKRMRGPMFGFDEDPVIPNLKAPPGARQYGGGAGGGGYDWRSEAELVTDIDLSGVAAYY